MTMNKTPVEYEAPLSPAYSEGQAPIPPCSAEKQGMAQNKVYYWVYWGVLFATLITWVFAVTAAAHDGLVDGYSNAGYENAYCDGVDVTFCKLLSAAKAFQYMATILISVIIVMVVVAAFMPAPKTGKLGLATGISLAVFSVFQLIAFSLHAAYIAELNKTLSGLYYQYNYSAGPNLGVGIMAWIFGTAGAVVTLVLFRRATTDQDGPFRQVAPNLGNMGSVKTEAPATTTAVQYPDANV